MKITPADVDSVIAGEQYHRFPDTNHTVCCLKLLNGFTVIGESVCVDTDELDEAKGREIARLDALQKVYPLEAYMLLELEMQATAD